MRMSDRSDAPARELAARAICKARRLPETVTIDGAPLWERFLPEADAVLEAIGWVTDEAEEQRRQELA